MTVKISYESKGGKGRLPRMTIRAMISELKIGDQRLLMHTLGRLMIDEIRSQWSQGYDLDGNQREVTEVLKIIRRAEAAVLTKKIESRRRAALRKLKVKGPTANKPIKPVAAAKPAQQDAHVKAEKERRAKMRREWEAKVVKNYKIRSPRFTRTSIHGSVKPRSRDYIPDPKNPSWYGSGLMKDSLYAVFLPQRTYKDKKTGEPVLVGSGVQFVVQKNRYLAAYRAGLRDRGVTRILYRISSADLDAMSKHYIAWDGSDAWSALKGALKMASNVAGLVEATLGFLV